ncbi:electron transfer flavoprotein subunit alpha/FixB family protein [Sellimonas intestinalis]|uniref:electron transfer flavoprotein subunit alpha/FixB family protein n=1 Tax=Sellimonas intestinalis TaxID=1653434 RepID=UPI0015EC6530|nr:electron transfer flavoprotein subunit alpha/FixB family protein [Sellimonas intestinalis]MBA2213297.1 electron transfer flavoprotein subunit alpha/FixB family protein [Sellimonas intestinalis]
MNKENIAVFCIEGAVNYKAHSLQILSKAAQITKEKNTNVILCYIGNYDKFFFEKAGKCGADVIEFYPSDDDKLVRCNIMCRWCDKLLEKYKFKFAFFMGEEYGKRVAAILSTRYECGLIADCINVTYDEEGIFFYRIALNDAIVAKIKCTNDVFQLASIREGVFKEEYTDNEAVVVQNEAYIKKETSSVKIIEKKNKKPVENVDLSKAKIIFGIGRGACDDETLSLLRNVANKYGAELVGTRPVIEDGILPKCRQVGQSGRSIAPDLYVAFGISGTSQHIVGIKKAKCIIAVNNDRNVQIFKYADYAMIGNIKEILEDFCNKNICNCEVLNVVR